MKNVVRYRLDILARVFVDIWVLSLCTFAALAVDFSMTDLGGVHPLVYASQHLLLNVCTITPAGIVIFWLGGLYSAKIRASSILQKSFRVFLAVASLFTVVALARNFFGGAVMPGKSFLIAWIMTLSSCITCRIWARVWGYLVLSDRQTNEVLETRIRAKSVLVIGGAGYIGSALLPKLLANGYKVRLLDSFVYGEEPISEFLDHRDLEIMRADFRQVDKVVEAMQGMGTVIHLGAIVGDPACALNEELTIEVNLVATRMIAEVAKGAGVSRFIFASTCSVYGVSDALLEEDSQLNPISLYARSKIACEQVLLGMKDRSFSPVVLRFGTIYGLSGRTRFDLVVNVLSAQALVEGQMTIFGSDQWRPFIHVDDAARAVLMATEADVRDIEKMVFNVGSDEQNLTIGDLGALILGRLPSAKLSVINENVDKRNYRVSFQRIREELGFLPLWSLSDGVDQVLQAIQDGSVSDYRLPKYSNVRFLQEEGKDTLKVQNGWAKDLIETGWTAERMKTPSTSLALLGD